MKKVILSLLAIILVVGLLAVTGFTGYRLGYAQGMRVTVNGNTSQPAVRPFNHYNPGDMPMMRNFAYGRGFQRGFGAFPFMGFGLFSPFRILGWLILLALVFGFAYWLFTRSGWRLTRQTTTTQTTTEPNSTKTEG